MEYGGRRSVIELKIWRSKKTEEDGIRQLSAYLDRLGEAEGYLVLFDRRKRQSWADKIYIHEQAGPARQRIYVFGM